MIRCGSKHITLEPGAGTGKIPIYRHGKMLIPYTKLKKYFDYTEPVYNQYMEYWLNVHQNQYQAGVEIIDYFQDGINDVILMAEMQSGKTGTTRYVVHVLQHLTAPPGWDENRFIPERIYFVCGMNDNDLKNQAIKEFEGFIPSCNIMFSKQLQKYNQNAGDMDPNTRPSLVIVDESHYASFRSSQVDKFLKHIYSPDLLTLSVSATAMAELACGEAKGRVYLRPGIGYYSIKELFSRGLIKQSVDITKQQQMFIDLVVNEYEYQRSCADLKYNIIRLPSQWYYKDLEEDLQELDLAIQFVNHHTCEDMSVSDFNDYVCEPPKSFTIIWIYGSLRAGKQLNTSNIGFVHDTAHSGPDIIAQSLLGRILGYHKSKNFVKCYTDVKSAKLMMKWIQSAYDVMKIPMGSKGIIGGYSAILEERNWELHTPLLIAMDSDMRSHYRTLKQQCGNRYPYKEQFFVDLALTATDNREKIIDILENYEPGHCGGLMILTEDNKSKSFRDHWSSNYKACVDGTYVHCCNVDTQLPGKYFYIYVNLNMQSSEYGAVLVTYKEHVDVGGQPGRAAVRVKCCSRFRSYSS